MTSTRTAVLQRYDFVTDNPLVEAHYEGSGFLNFGYWEPGVASQARASEALVDRLVQHLHRRGTVLDVACGLGGTTRTLLKTWRPADVTAINISERQLDRARQNAPGATFLNMSATAMDFGDATFDDVLCVEAAFHFETRLAFLREAYRVLKPGGRIALTDVLLPRFAWMLSRRIPTANYVRDLAAYGSLCESVGFRHVAVEDITAHCLPPFFSQLFARVRQFRRTGQVNFGQYLRIMGFWRLQQFCVRKYILVSAEKP